MKGLADYYEIQFRGQDYSLRTATIVTLAYWFVCSCVTGVIFLSWYFVIEITTLSPGIIRPYLETTMVRSAVSGRIRRSFVQENQYVKAGDTLYLLETEALMIRYEYLSGKLHETKQIIDDLKNVLAVGDEKALRTSLIQQSWYTYLQKSSEAETRLRKAQSDYARNLKLYRQRVIAESEFETYKFELDRATNDVALVKKIQRNQWEHELADYERNGRSTESELAEVCREIKNMVIISPITGTVQKFAGIYPGSIIYANQDLAQISPDTDLIVEAYASPHHIGLLRVGMKVRFLIDAFNYNQWGFAEGHIVDISDDSHIVNERPVFKVRCSLRRNYLELKSGYKGELKKGMSLKARFIVTERTLWQLLSDKVDDWLNPGR